jgi:hypothetical protein
LTTRRNADQVCSGIGRRAARAAVALPSQNIAIATSKDSAAMPATSLLRVSLLPDERSSDLRFSVLLYTLTEASKYLLVPRQTLTTWAEGYERRAKARAVVKARPIVTSIPDARPGRARLPFIGLAEAYVLNAFRRAGAPMQRMALRRPNRPASRRHRAG